LLPARKQLACSAQGYSPNKITQRRKKSASARPYRQGLCSLQSCCEGGSDASDERAAAIYNLTGPGKLNGLDPEAYLPKCAPALPIIPSIASRNCFHGI